MSNDILHIWLYCSGCKTVLRRLIDETDCAKSWAIGMSSPAMKQTVCPYCESNKRVRLNVSIDLATEEKEHDTSIEAALSLCDLQPYQYDSNTSL